MTKGKDGEHRPVRRGKPKPPSAFDQWLTRGLHELFDDVAREPIPEDLLRLIEDDQG
ncbi:NepR family anti-sigma factor [Lichenicoccus sp.]|uniref:NepR family anti-sigma factor n=1 Tax=Lichenicoccus sp. TaxID=2781899 RepID=UPI003D13D9C2